MIEPAKGEYRTAFGGLPGIRIFTTNPRYHRMLQINPFRFDSHIHVLEHLDRLDRWLGKRSVKEIEAELGRLLRKLTEERFQEMSCCMSISAVRFRIWQSGSERGAFSQIPCYNPVMIYPGCRNIQTCLS